MIEQITRLVLVGYFAEVIELLGAQQNVTIEGYTDRSNIGRDEVRFLGDDTKFLSQYKKEFDLSFFVSPDLPQVRKHLVERYLSYGLSLFSIFSNLSFVSSGSHIGPGAILQRFSSVSTNSNLGVSVRLNYYANVTHDVEIGDYCTIAPAAQILGGVTIGACTYIGANATILPGVKIGSNSIIGAGSVVTRDVPDNVVAYGNPAKVEKINATKNN